MNPNIPFRDKETALKVSQSIKKEAETDRLGFKASLAYRVSSRTASVTQRNCIMKKKQKTKMN